MALLNRKVLVDSLLRVGRSGGQGQSGPVKTFVDQLERELGDRITAEVPAGAINGSNKNFTTANKFSDLWVWLNGVRQNPNTPGADYAVTGAAAFSMTNAPQAGDVLLVDYTEAA